MRVRCKFRCIKNGQTTGWTKENPTLTFSEFAPVTPGESEENKQFWEASPSGLFQLSNTKGLNFEVGKEYYLDITPAEASAEQVAG